MNDEAPKQLSIADRFRRLADRIDQNADAGFGGAFLIVPPDNGGEVIETLILDTRQDPAQFWTLLKTKCDTELIALDAARRGQQLRR